MTHRYISDGTWFDEGTEAEWLAEVIPPARAADGVGTALFRGVRDGRIDEEVCRYDEFVVRDE